MSEEPKTETPVLVVEDQSKPDANQAYTSGENVVSKPVVEKLRKILHSRHSNYKKIKEKQAARQRIKTKARIAKHSRNLNRALTRARVYPKSTCYASHKNGAI